jgi:hypothetical protein
MYVCNVMYVCMYVTHLLASLAWSCRDCKRRERERGREEGGREKGDGGREKGEGGREKGEGGREGGRREKGVRGPHSIVSDTTHTQCHVWEPDLPQQKCRCILCDSLYSRVNRNILSAHLNHINRPLYGAELMSSGTQRTRY